MLYSYTVYLFICVTEGETQGFTHIRQIVCCRTTSPAFLFVLRRSLKIAQNNLKFSYAPALTFPVAGIKLCTIMHGRFHLQCIRKINFSDSDFLQELAWTV